MRTALLVALFAGAAAPAGAQMPRPIPIAVMDVRGFYSSLGRDPVTADDLDIQPAAFPSRALGGVAGLHVYVIRGKTMALGVGGEGVIARGRAQAHDDTGLAVGLPVEQRFLGLSGVVSLNFGHRDGWSYVSAGMGPLSFATFQGTSAPVDPPPRQMTINLGGGARWFAKRHVAFCFDVRFYQTEPEVKTLAYPPRQRARLLVLSAGVAFK